MEHKLYGNAGEATAFYYLKENGYKIIKTNFVCKIGEIDIIAEKDNMLCFIEVKARNTAKFGLPREAVTYAKQRKIKMIASYFLQKTKMFDKICRFDVIEILGDKIEHIQNAFI